MIILQTGVPGSGKTSSVVNMLMTDESYTHFTDKDGVKKKRPLFVNGIPELKIEHEELSDEQIKSQPFQDLHVPLLQKYRRSSKHWQPTAITV